MTVQHKFSVSIPPMIKNIDVQIRKNLRKKTIIFVLGLQETFQWIFQTGKISVGLDHIRKLWCI